MRLSPADYHNLVIRLCAIEIVSDRPTRLQTNGVSYIYRELSPYNINKAHPLVFRVTYGSIDARMALL